MTLSRWTSAAILWGALSSCGGSDEPSAGDIATAYSNIAKKEYELAVQNAGGEANVPPVLSGLLKFRYSVKKTDCEKAEGDIGFMCIYDLTVTAANGQHMPEIKDVKGRIYKGSSGWLVEEQ